jgi:hypothetical protein
MKFYMYDGVHHNRHYDKVFDWDYIESDDQDAPTEGLYFFLARGRTPYFDTNECRRGWDAYNFGEKMGIVLDVINDAKGTKYTMKDVYGVPASTYKKIKDNKKWINIFDLARECLPKQIPHVEFHHRLSNTPDDLGVKELVKDPMFIAHVEKLDTTSSFRQNVQPLIDGFKIHETKLKLAGNVIEIDRNLNNVEDKIFNTTGDPFYSDGCFTCYPMLTFVGTLRINSDDKAGSYKTFFDYINLVDRS